jgi:hypothetical protein
MNDIRKYIIILVHIDITCFLLAPSELQSILITLKLFNVRSYTHVLDIVDNDAA